MVHRRSFIIGLAAAAAVPGLTSARDIGVRGLDRLWPALDSMHAISMGSGPRLDIVVAPGCSAAGEMWDGAVEASSHCLLRWIPVGSGYESDEVEVSRCLTIGTPEAVRQLLKGNVDGEASIEGNVMAARQRRIYADSVERLMWESTGRAPAVPTLVFLDRAEKVRVVRGAIPVDRFREVFEAMGA